MNRKEQIAGLKAEVAALVAKGADALTDEDLETLEAKGAEIATLEAAEAEAKAKDDARRESLAKAQGYLEDVKAAAVKAAASSVVQVKETRTTPGEAFAKSPEYEALLKSHPNGLPTGVPVPMSAVNVGGVKALLTNPGLQEPRHVVATPGLSITGLTEAITVIDDAPETIKVFRAAFTSAAGNVAEGALKPEASLTWTPETLNLGTVAHHIPVTVQSLSHNAIMRGLVDTFLVNGVRAKVETDVATTLAGTAGLGVQAFDTDLRTTLRKAITKAQNAGAQVGSVPTGILISANDAETLDLEQLANLVLAPGQTPAQASGIWRTPLVVSPQIEDGFAYVGDLRQVFLYTAGAVKVMTGWINAQFVENELTILAETEAVSTVLVAPAIVKADLTAV